MVLHMIFKSLKLTRLRWYAGPHGTLTTEQIPINQLVHAIQTGRWTKDATAKIQHLDLPRADFQIPEFRVLLQATPNQMSLGLTGTNLSPPSWTVLREVGDAAAPNCTQSV